MRLKPPAYKPPGAAFYPLQPWLRPFIDWSERTPQRDEDWRKHNCTGFGLGPDSCDFENFCGCDFENFYEPPLPEEEDAETVEEIPEVEENVADAEGVFPPIPAPEQQRPRLVMRAWPDEW